MRRKLGQNLYIPVIENHRRIIERKQEISNKIKEYALCNNTYKYPAQGPIHLIRGSLFAFWSIAVRITLTQELWRIHVFLVPL